MKPEPEDDAEMSAINSLMGAEAAEQEGGEDGAAKPDPQQVVASLEQSLAQLKQIVGQL